jgi:hypothetical protein
VTEYEIIDAICDSVNPILFFIAIGVVTASLVKKSYKLAGVVSGQLFFGLLLVYGMQILDSTLKIWESFGGDYSTHTAFSIAASIAISAGKHWAKWLVGVFFLYVVAMLYQQYHSLLDIVTTTLVIGGPLILVRRYLRSFLAPGVANMDSKVNFQ